MTNSLNKKATHILLPAWAILGWGFLLEPRNYNYNTLSLPFVFETLVAFALALNFGYEIVAQRDTSPGQAITAVASLAILIIQIFTITYYGLGTVKNFSQPLSRLDALYVALGNFTTAGTGNISPTSDLARTWVVVQYCADVVLLVGLLSFLLWRLGTDHQG